MAFLVFQIKKKKEIETQKEIETERDGELKTVKIIK